MPTIWLRQSRPDAWRDHPGVGDFRLLAPRTRLNATSEISAT
jgi:hypothetical protein